MSVDLTPDNWSEVTAFLVAHGVDAPRASVWLYRELVQAQRELAHEKEAHEHYEKLWQEVYAEECTTRHDNIALQRRIDTLQAENKRLDDEINGFRMRELRRAEIERRGKV